MLHVGLQYMEQMEKFCEAACWAKARSRTGPDRVLGIRMGSGFETWGESCASKVFYRWHFIGCGAGAGGGLRNNMWVDGNNQSHRIYLIPLCKDSVAKMRGVICKEPSTFHFQNGRPGNRAHSEVEVQSIPNPKPILLSLSQFSTGS